MPFSAVSSSASEPAVHIQALDTPLQLTEVRGSDLAPDILKPIHQAAQTYADAVSRRRQIPYFNLHTPPVGWALDQEAYLLSFLGTAKTGPDLNVELRALVSGPSVDLNLNYSGPVTGQTAAPLSPQNTRSGPFHFELLMGLPGNGVTDAYGDHLSRLGRHLQTRYQARPFQFDDGPLVYAITKDDRLKGFVFMNQGNRLVLGERKYADVQSMMVFSPQRERLGSLTLIGFNPKTPDPSSPPQFRTLPDTEPYGSLLEFGAL